MGYAISGTTGWLNRAKSGGHIKVQPSVRRTADDEVLLRVRWRTARKRARRHTAKSLLVAKRHIWNRWTSGL